MDRGRRVRRRDEQHDVAERSERPTGRVLVDRVPGPEIEDAAVKLGDQAPEAIDLEGFAISEEGKQTPNLDGRSLDY